MSLARRIHTAPLFYCCRQPPQDWPSGTNIIRLRSVALFVALVPLSVAQTNTAKDSLLPTPAGKEWALGGVTRHLRAA